MERDVADDLTGRDVGYGYEATRIKFTSTHSYVPDFVLPNGVLVEVKGWFKPSDRAKHLRIKEQHPDIDIRFVFSNARQKLSRNSITNYGQWCYRYGFIWAEKKIPQGWLNESSKRTKQQLLFET